MGGKKAAERILRENEENFRTLVENSNDIIMRIDRTYRHLYVNSIVEKLSEIPAAQWIGKTSAELGLVSKNDISGLDSIDEVFRTGKIKRIEIEISTGDWFDCLFMPEMDDAGNVETVIMSARDISDRKKSENALLRRLEFERIISAISSEFVGLAPENLDAAINRALASMGGFSGADRAYVFLFHEGGQRVDNTHEWCRSDITSQIHRLKNIEIGRALPWFSKQIRTDKVVFIPAVSRLPDEAEKERAHFETQAIFSLVVVPMKSGNRVIGFIGFDAVHPQQEWTEDDQFLLRVVGEIFTNAIERNRSDREQKNLQTKLANAMEMAHLGPWEYDVKTDLFTFNDHFYKMFRTTVEAVGGYAMTPEDYAHRFVHPDDMYIIREEIENAIISTDKEFKRQFEHKICFPDGTDGQISVRYFRVRDSRNSTIKLSGVNQDISESKIAEARIRESEEKLARSKKMESLGLLAGGVAHDLNNVLAGVVGYPDLLLLKLPEDSALRKPIEAIKASGLNAVAIVEDMLTIARGVASAKEAISLNAVVSKYLSSPEFAELGRCYPGVNVRTDLDPNLLNMKGSDIHINKVVMNLVSNAMEAIEESGHVIIKTRNRYADRPISGYSDVDKGEYTVLTVSDSGAGISPDSLERIFEPFFTKKVMGRSGTGLGLAVVWNIVQDHEGIIDVKSDQNGTTFKLYFPITRSQVSKETMSVSIEALKGNGQKILVVDDVESQREISSSMLRILGYRTDVASSGEEAVEWLRENTADLILLDMIMDPGMNGRETYKKIIEIYPGQKAVIASGFAETEDVGEAQRLGAGEFIRKPLTLETLGAAVKRALKM